MFCDNCGYHNREAATFCAGCGNQLEPALASGLASASVAASVTEPISHIAVADPVRMRHRAVGAWLLLVSVTIIGGIMGWLFRHPFASSKNPQPTESRVAAQADASPAATEESEPISPPPLSQSPDSEVSTDNPGAEAYRLIHGIEVTPDCERGMELMTAQAEKDIGARRFLSTEYVDGNVCTIRDYMYAMKILVTEPKQIETDPDTTSAMISDLKSLMSSDEKADTAAFTPSQWESLQPSTTTSHASFRIPFLAVSAIYKVLKDDMTSHGDEPFGDPVWVETTYKAYAVFQRSTCHITTHRSTPDRCQRAFGLYVPVADSREDTLRVLLNIRSFPGQFGPVFAITSLVSPAANVIRLNETYEADGSHSEVEFTFNGYNFNLTDAALHHPGEAGQQ